MNQEINRRKQNWLDFADLQSDVNRLLVLNCAEGMPTRPLMWWECKEQRIDWAYETYERQVANMEWLHDNTVPYLSLVTGTEIFAEAFGCRVHKPQDNNPFALPLISDVSEFSKIKMPRLEDTQLYTIFEMADRLLQKADKGALLGLPDIQSPTDIAALIWDKNDFYIAMINEPEAVKELCGMVKEFLCGFFDRWFARYGTAFIAHYPAYYMPKGITLSEDEIGAVSSDMYHEFFEGELTELSYRYGGIGIHCCANSKHQWENLSRVPNLKILNLARDAVETPESINYFYNVCAQYPSLYDFDHTLIEHPSKAHVAYFPEAQTKPEAIALVEKFKG